MDIGALTTRNARYRPDHVALVFEDQVFTHAQFNARVNRCANMLRGLGLGKGDKVATVLGNCVELMEVYWAAAKLGAVAVPLSPLLKPAGLATLLADSDTAVVVTSASGAELIDEVRSELAGISEQRYVLVDREARSGYQSYHALCDQASADEPPAVAIAGEDPYNIIYSSGTTGLPKGIVLSHQVRALYCTLFALAYRMSPESVILHGGSIVFNGSFLTLMPWMYLGAKYVLMPQYRPGDFMAAVAEHEVTHVMMVPSQIVALLNDPGFSAQALESLVMICSVGAPLHEEHKRKLEERLPGRFHELYGLTEGFMTQLDKNDVPAKLTSVGVPLPFFDMRIVDEAGDDLPAGQAGEIVGRGPLLMSGYYKRPDLTAKAMIDGWLYTGDVGYVDEDGYLYLVDRQKDLIISGGINVYPRDIEEVMARHPRVREVAVFGVPSAKWGETPMAAVVLHDSISGESSESMDASALASELAQWTNERVAAKYQRVSAVVIVDELPRGVTGKVLKRALREQYQDQQA